MMSWDNPLGQLRYILPSANPTYTEGTLQFEIGRRTQSKLLSTIYQVLRATQVSDKFKYYGPVQKSGLDTSTIEIYWLSHTGIVCTRRTSTQY
jgi:hypothetical protein